MIRSMILCLCLIASVSFSRAAAAEENIAKRIVGAWSLVAVTAERADGSKIEPFGTNPKGIIIFTDSGHFSLFQSIAYYGTYSVNEMDKSLSVTLDGATFANLLGGAQRRDITSLTADELGFSNPRTPSGMTLQTVWRRATAQ